MRRLIATAVVVAAVLTTVVGAPHARADGDDDCTVVIDDQGVAHRQCDESGGGGGPGNGGGGGGPVEQRYPFPEIDIAQVPACVATVYLTLPEIAARIGGLVVLTVLDPIIAATYLALLAVLPACPNQPVPVLTPALFAQQWFDDYPLPVPAPQIDPGEMIVGIEAFLEAGSPVTQDPPAVTTPFGPATMRLESQLFVDWGDGSGEEGPFTTAGGPYPDGDLRHVYERHGRFDVVVRQMWSLVWTIGAQAGRIDGTQTQGVLAGFPVTEVEAVIHG